MQRIGAWAALLAIFGGGLWVLSADSLGSKLAHGLLITAILTLLLADADGIVSGLNNLVDRATGPEKGH